MTPAADPGSGPNSGRKTAGPKRPTRARHGPCERSMTRPSSAGRWRSCPRGSAPYWCCATGLTCPSPRSLTSSAARKGRSPAPPPGLRPAWPEPSRTTRRQPAKPAVRNHEREHLMPTEELENELRRAFALAAADIPEPEQARQRLLQRNYRPGRGHRQLAAAITATTATAVVLGLGLAGAF